MLNDELYFEKARAEAELDLARRAADLRAARAHLALGGLHLLRLRATAAAQSGAAESRIP